MGKDYKTREEWMKVRDAQGDKRVPTVIYDSGTLNKGRNAAKRAKRLEKASKK